MNHLTNCFFCKSLILTGALLVVMNSCSKSTKMEPDILPEKEYSLLDMRYFMSNTDYLDTLTLQLQDTTLYNSNNLMAITMFPDNISGLVKTSQFEITNIAELPTDVKFEHFEINVPADYQNNFFSYSSLKVPFTTEVAMLPYKSNWSDTIVVKVPARSSILVNRSIHAYNITCSFTAVIEEKTTRQTYPVKGIWKGLLRYDNLSTTLTQHPL